MFSYYVGTQFNANPDHVTIYIDLQNGRYPLLTVLNACGENQKYTTDLLTRLRAEYAVMTRNLNAKLI